MPYKNRASVLARQSSSTARAVSLGAVLLLAAACGDNGARPAAGVDAGPPVDAAVDAADVASFPPAFRNPVDLTDERLAEQAVAVLGRGTGTSCSACHPITRTRLQGWAGLTRAAGETCLTDLAPTTAAAATSIVDCLRGQPPGEWSPHALGINAIAAGLPWFEYVFHRAFGAQWEAQFATWRAKVEMPRGDQPKLTQAQFDVVAAWFGRGLPGLENVVPEAPPPQCVPGISPAIATHVSAMATAGWGALNREAGLLMYGCQGASTPGACLASKPLASSQPWGVAWAAAGTQLRLLREQTYESSFWTRSSADGRFVAQGGSASEGANATIIDLVQDREIPTEASYDPGFFPDNSGFVFQGQSPFFCTQSLLTRSPARITFLEPECSNVASIALYQHLGAVRGGDYWVATSEFTSDFASGPDPIASFTETAITGLTPIIHTGDGYVAKPRIDVATGHNGDTVISPSSTLLVSRLGNGDGEMTGFVVRQLLATRAGDSYTVQTPVAATYCDVHGGKPSFSFDERWLVYHHYVTDADWASLGYPAADDPAFRALVEAGAANLFLLDLTTGQTRRITTMGPGQLALFPHFRSDGWIYAIVKDHNRQRELIVASDAAIAP